MLIVFRIIQIENLMERLNKINQIEILINQIDKHFNIIAFAETRKINEKMINIIKSTNSYEYVNPKLNRCGGLLLIINKEVEYTIKEEYKLNENTADDIWIEYNQNNKKNLIASIYRHPLNDKQIYQIS